MSISFTPPNQSEYLKIFGKSSCVAAATAFAFGIDKYLVLEKLIELGLKRKMNSRGLFLDEQHQLWNELGLKFKQIHKIETGRLIGGETVRGMKEGEFREILDPTKIYLVSNRNHMWVVKEGFTVDPYWNIPHKQNGRREIRRLHEVI